MVAKFLMGVGHYLNEVEGLKLQSFVVVLVVKL